MFYTQKKLGFYFDWKKIKRIIEIGREIIEWRYYVGVKEGDEKMTKYLRYLNNIDFTTFTKPLKKIRIDATQMLKELISKHSILQQNLLKLDAIPPTFIYIYKANFDVEITSDLLADKSKLDEAIIFTGDSDFRYLIKKIRDRGLGASIYSSRKTISWELKLEASKIVYLEDIKERIKRQ